jgi:hypothetical protein
MGKSGEDSRNGCGAHMAAYFSCKHDSAERNHPLPAISALAFRLAALSLLTVFESASWCIGDGGHGMRAELVV